ncbi:hypothetical protein KI387_000353, partial [Taxus chinensis]
MADIVQYKLEHMIPELDDLEKRGLFIKAEIKEIVKKRRDFEYLLKRPCPLKEDYIRYIEYEKQLEALRNLRKKEMVRGLKENNKKWHFSLCDKASSRRILDIYRRLLTRNKGEFEALVRVLGKALNYHPNVPGLWIYAAAWEFEHNLNVNAARALMLSGIRACPKSEILWLEYFRMELIFVNKLRARKIALGLDTVSSLRDDEDKEAWKKENNDLFMSLNEEKLDDGEILETETSKSEMNADVLAIRELGFKMAYTIFNKAVDTIPSSVRFRQQFVEMLDSLDVQRANALEDEMCRSMQRDFANDESCWDWLARQHISRCQQTKQINKDEVVAALNKTIQVYEDALNTITSSCMFGYYTKFLQNLIDYDKSEIAEGLALFRRFVSNVEEIAMNILKLYERAECIGCVNEDLAEQHISFLLKVGDVDAARQLAAKFCTDVFSKAAKIWNLRMSLEIKSVMMNSTKASKADFQSLFELFKHVLLAIPVSESHHLWHLAMEFFSSQRDHFDQILNMLARAFSGGGGGSAGAYLLSTAVDWVLQNQGVKCAREMYK